MTFNPSAMQAKAISTIKDWFENWKCGQQVFKVFGYAGVGKSTLVKHAMGELGLADGSDVLYAAFTGKAALVMTRKGTPASTIHSLIYRVSEATPEEIDRVEQDLRELNVASAAWDRRTRLRGDADQQAAAAPRRHPQADLPAERAVAGRATPTSSCWTRCRWWAPEMAADLLAFGKPILVLGDPGPAAADQGCWRLHRGKAGYHAHRDPPPGRRECHHPPRHHGAAGHRHPVRRA